VVDQLLDKEAVEQVHNVHSPGFYNFLFTREKPDGSLRPIIDMKPLNKYIAAPHFKQETMQSIRASLIPGEWTTSLDLKDAYMHILMPKQIRKYFRFTVGHSVYQFRVLPFGLNVAPKIFTDQCKPILQRLRQEGVNVHAYLDDWLIRGSGPQETEYNTRRTAQLLQDLGWIINVGKSRLVPSQRFQFLGVDFDLKEQVVRPKSTARAETQVRWEKFRVGHWSSARQVSSAVGWLQFLGPLVPRGRLHLRPIQQWFRARWSQARGDWRDQILVDEELTNSLQWWDNNALFQGVPLHQPDPEVSLCTDASRSGWGAQLGENQASGIWPSSLQDAHINELEMRAIGLALRQFRKQVQNKIVRIHCDNATTVTYLRKEGGTHADHLTQLTREILLWCDSVGTTIIPVHLAGSRNVLADSLSRRGQTQPGEWSISAKYLRHIFQEWGNPMMDMMATPENTRCPTFVCPFPHDQAWTTDALSISWSNLGTVYCFPPPILVKQVLDKIRRAHGTQLILIASKNPIKTWHPLIKSMATEGPLTLPTEEDLLWQTVHMPRKTTMFHTCPRLLELAAWRISAGSSGGEVTTRRQ
jgi:hypothetical protein